MTIPRLFAAALRAGVLLLALSAVAAAGAAGQRASGALLADTLYEARRAGGFQVVGRVVEQHGDSLVLESLEGHRVSLDRRRHQLRIARGRIVDGEYWREDANRTRLFFAPTGRTLRADEGYAGLFLILPFVGYGFGDAFTLAGGIPSIAGTLANTPVYIAPKLRIHADSERHVAVGAFLVRLPDWDFGEHWYDETPGTGDARISSIGIGYGVASFGGADRAVHMGSGVALTNADAGPYVPLMLGGEYRFGRTTKWITENWWVPGVFSSASAGIRVIRTNWTTDVGLMFLLSEADVPFFPIVSFSYAFGSGR